MAESRVVRRRRHWLLGVTLAQAWLLGAGAAAQCPVTDPGPPAGASEVRVATIGALQAALAEANRGGNPHIVLEPGVYVINRPLVVRQRGITVRGATGQRDAVEIRGQGMGGGPHQVFVVEANNFTLADLSAGAVRYHVVQVRGESDADWPRFINVRFFDSGQQLLKVSHDASSGNASDNGLVERSLFEFTAGVAAGAYSGGIDVHRGHGWIVRDSEFRGIRSPDAGLAEHAIHFWIDAAHTLVERNRIVDVDRGIGFGLGARGHLGGIIRNNTIMRTRDVGIGLENSPGAVVVHNTVLTGGYPHAIEYRFAATRNVLIQNNLTDTAVRRRDGASAEVLGNRAGARPEWFADAAAGDLHLVAGVPQVIAAGLVAPDAGEDMDCEPRPAGAAPDIGADQTTLGPDPALAASAPSAWAETYRSVRWRAGELGARARGMAESQWRERPALVAAVAAGTAFMGLHFLLTLYLALRVRALARTLRRRQRAKTPFLHGAPPRAR